MTILAVLLAMIILADVLTRLLREITYRSKCRDCRRQNEQWNQPSDCDMMCAGRLWLSSKPNIEGKEVPRSTECHL